MTVHLIIESSVGRSPAASRFDFERGRITIGRLAANDWVLEDPDHVISKTHCELIADETGVSILDRSTNGVFLNGSSVPVGRGNDARLADGDRIEIGDYVIRVSIEQQATPDFLRSPFSEPSATEMTEILPSAAEPDFGGSEPAGEIGPAEPLVGGDPLGLGEDSPGEEQRSGFPASDHVPFDAEFMPAPSIDDAVSGESPLDFAPLSGGAPTGKAAAAGSRQPILPDDLSLDDLLGPASDQGGAGRSTEDARADMDAALPQEPLVVPLTEPGDGSAGAAGRATSPEEPTESIDTIGPAPLDFGPEVSVAPPQAPGGEDQGGLDQASPFEAFLQSAGIRPDGSVADPVRMAQASGVLFRKMLDGLIVLLQARMVVKNEYQLERTLLRPVANNPLKSLPSVDEILGVLYRSEESTGVWLDAESAVDEAIRDLKAHDLALVAGMNAVIEHFVTALNPERFSVSRNSDRKRLLSISALEKAKEWDKYQAEYTNLHRTLEDGLTGEARAIFERAYNREKQRLEG